MLTLTDYGVACKLTTQGDAALVADVPADLRVQIGSTLRAMLANGIDRIRTDARELPLLAVGGGAFLIPPDLPGIAGLIAIPYHAVANAVGAAIGEVSGEADRILRGDRDAGIAAARATACERAIAAGADGDKLRVVVIEDQALNYLGDDERRVRIKVVGPLAERLLIPKHRTSGAQDE